MKFSCPRAPRKIEKAPGNWADELLALPKEQWAKFVEENVPGSMVSTLRLQVHMHNHRQKKQQRRLRP